MWLLAGCIAALSGCIVGISMAVVWLVLDIPSRITNIFRVQRANLCGWSLLAGMLFGAVMPLAGKSLHLGTALGVWTLLLGGTMTGMLASALAEVVDVAPRLISRFRLVRASRALCWSMAVGKAIGAFAAAYWTLW